MKFKLKRYVFFLFFSLLTFFINYSIKSEASNKYQLKNKLKQDKKYNSLNYKNSEKFLAEIKWKKSSDYDINPKKIIWETLDNEVIMDDDYFINEEKSKYDSIKLGSLNRSIVFDDLIVGPDISWLVPPGLSWNKKYKFDLSTRGHNRREEGEPFLGWNDGDAVGQFYYQPIFLKNYSLGLNLGMRSIYSGSSKIAGGTTEIGEGLSLGFRLDKKLSNTSGVALGAEQLVHFNGITDTGRDLYLTVSKGWFSNNINGDFPLTVATFGFATGKMAEGNIKGLCSELFGGSGTEAHHKRPLCWAPVFSLARVYNTKFSTFFEYNSKWFLLGSSLSPFENIPLRGTFAIQLSDHIENYKINSFDELKWVFRLSLGF